MSKSAAVIKTLKFMGRQSEKMISKNACKYKNFSDQNCRCKLYRYKLIVK